MAIQKVSDLPILRQTNKNEFRYDRVRSSLMEISYKISSDEEEGVSQYKSMAVTVAELADYVLSAQDKGDTANLSLSGDVFLNAATPDAVAQNYQVKAKTGRVETTVFRGYALSSPDIKFNCNDFAVKTAGNFVLKATDEAITFSAPVEFTQQVSVPAITDSSSPDAAVNFGYLKGAIPAIESPFILFETKYLDYNLSSDHWVNTATAGWLSSQDFPNAFSHLRDDWANGSDYTVSYHTGGVSIDARKAPDGHIICQAGVSAAVDALFNRLSSAWVYVIDPVNLRFRLPRNGNFVKGCCGLAGAGEYVPPTLPEHTHGITYNRAKCACDLAGGIKNSPHNELTSDMSTNGAVYPSAVKKANTVLPPAVQMYLYMYCS